MLKYIFVIALALPFCVFAKQNKSESWVLQPQCFSETNKKLNLTYNNYTKMLTSYVNKKDSESLAKLKASLANFTKVVTETCAGGKMPSTVDISFFIDLIQFAVKDDNYFNFTNSNGISCVEAAEPDIRECIHDHLGSKNNSKAGNDTNVNASDAHGAHDVQRDNDTNIVQNHFMQNVLGLLKKTNLEFNKYTCYKTKAIRTCVVSAMMKKHNATCTTEHSEFVDSLFNLAYSMKKCSLPSRDADRRSGANSFLFNPVAILLPLIGTMLIR